MKNIDSKYYISNTTIPDFDKPCNCITVFLTASLVTGQGGVKMSTFSSGPVPTGVSVLFSALDAGSSN